MKLIGRTGHRRRSFSYFSAGVGGANELVLILLLGLGAFVVACGGGDTIHDAGGEGGLCYADGTCDIGLECLSSLCVSTEICLPGARRPCSCSGSSSGVSECELNERWGECSCIDTCGDGACQPPDETEISCPQDCAQAANCGDNVAFGGVPGDSGYEICDGYDLRGQTCSSLNQPAGDLDCAPDCTWDFSDCTNPLCGDGHADAGEACDGYDFAGQTCVDFGFTTGELLCESCEISDTGCCNANLLLDFDHCGACQTSCDVIETDECTNGTCMCGGAPACDSANGLNCCGATCIDVSEDENNCGGCANSCPDGEICTGGACLCGSNPSCTGGQSCCDGSCVALDTTLYCGSCTNSCGTNEDCFSGTCGCGAAGVACTGIVPGSPGECCGLSGCVVFQVLQANGVVNCGSCGNNCAVGQFCIAGSCQ